MFSTSERRSENQVKTMSIAIVETCKKFGIKVEVSEVTVGCQFRHFVCIATNPCEIEKVSKIKANLRYALGSDILEIQASSEKADAGIFYITVRSIDNTETCRLLDVIESKDFKDKSDISLVPTYEDITGNLMYISLAEPVNFLIGGCTGSGKSMFLHTVIHSLISRSTPDKIQFILIDPKRVELTQYTNLLNLQRPVIVDSKEAVSALQWVTEETKRRLELLEREKCATITEYKGSNHNSMPYIVIIIDEFSDLMCAFPSEVENAIKQITPHIGSTGIKLIVSTSRPRKDIYTDTIRDNFVARIAFKTASAIDSETILGVSGAESLLGKGDMLFLSSAEDRKLQRLHGCYISDKEIRGHINSRVYKSL